MDYSSKSTLHRKSETFGMELSKVTSELFCCSLRFDLELRIFSTINSLIFPLGNCNDYLV